MAASNLLEKLDPALLRPGRFDRQVLVPPARPARPRGEILGVHTRNKPLGQDVDLTQVAQHTSGLTGADLANLCNEAAIQAGRAQRQFIAQMDFDNAFERVVAGPRQSQGDHRPREARRRLARGRPRAGLGAAAHGRQGAEGLDRAPRHGARLHAQPARGGSLPEDARGADRLHEGPARRPRGRADHLRPVTTGASDDLAKVTAIARGMVYEYGMGTSIRVPPASRRRLEHLRDDAPAP